MTKSHYDTLGVSKTSSLADIKKSFRKLCMETHPDVSAGNTSERFKQINEAYRILSSPKKRRLYDLEVEEATRFGGFDRMKRRRAAADTATKAARGTASHQGMHGVMDIIFRPSSVFLGLTIGMFTIVTLRGMFRETFLQDGNQRELKEFMAKSEQVVAWKNPNTNQWETPAPLDPTYRNLKPTLRYVPRDQVKLAKP